MLTPPIGGMMSGQLFGQCLEPAITRWHPDRPENCDMSLVFDQKTGSPRCVLGSIKPIFMNKPLNAGEPAKRRAHLRGQR